MAVRKPTTLASTVLTKFQTYMSDSARSEVRRLLNQIESLSKDVGKISSSTKDTTIEKYLLNAADLFKQIGLDDYAAYATDLVREGLSDVYRSSASSLGKEKDVKEMFDAAYSLISSVIALQGRSPVTPVSDLSASNKRISSIEQERNNIAKLLGQFDTIIGSKETSKEEKLKYAKQFNPFFSGALATKKTRSIDVPEGGSVSGVAARLNTIANIAGYTIQSVTTTPVSEEKYFFKIIDQVKKATETAVTNKKKQVTKTKDAVKEVADTITTAKKEIETVNTSSSFDIQNAIFGNPVLREFFNPKNRPEGTPPSARTKIANRLSLGGKFPSDLLKKDILHQATEITGGGDPDTLINRSRIFLKELGLFMKNPLQARQGKLGYDTGTWNVISQVFSSPEQQELIKKAFYSIIGNANIWKGSKADKPFIAEILAKEGKMQEFLNAVPDELRSYLIALSSSNPVEKSSKAKSKSNSSLFASSRAEQLANSLGITDLTGITPTGKGGKITVRDVTKYHKEITKTPIDHIVKQATSNEYWDSLEGEGPVGRGEELIGITPPITTQSTVVSQVAPVKSSWYDRARRGLGRMFMGMGDRATSAGGGGGIFWNLGGRFGGSSGGAAGAGGGAQQAWPANWKERTLSQSILDFRNRIIAEESQLAARVASGNLPPDSPLRQKEAIYKRLSEQVTKIPGTSQAIRGIVSHALAETHGDISTAFNYILGDYYKATLGQMTNALIEEAVSKDSEDPYIQALKDPNHPTQMLRTSRNESAYRELYERFEKTAKLHLSSGLNTRDLLTFGRVAKGSEIAASIGAPLTSALVGGTLRTLTAFPDAAIQEAGLSLNRMVGSGMAINRDLLWPLEFAMAGRSGWGAGFQGQFKQGVATSWKNAVPTATLSNLLTSYTGLLHVGDQEKMMQNIMSTVNLSRFGGLPSEAMMPSMTMLARLFPKDQQSDWRQFAGVIAGVFENKNLSKAMGTDEVVSMLDTLGSYFVGRAAEINPQTLARILGMVGQLNLSDQVPSGLKGALGLNTLLQLTQAVGPKQGEIISPLLAFLTGAGGSMANIMETSAQFAREGIFMNIPGTDSTLLEKILTDLPTMFGGEANAAAYLTQLGISPDISMAMMKLSEAVKSGEIKVTDEDTRKIIEAWIRGGAKGDPTAVLKGTNYERYNYMKLLESTTAYEEATANIGTIPLQMATDFRKQMSPVFGSLYTSLGDISMGLTDFLNPIGMFTNLFKGFKSLKNFYSEMPGVGSRGASLMSYQMLGEMGLNPQVLATLMIPTLTPIMGNLVEGMGKFFTGKLLLGGKLSGLNPALNVLGPAVLTTGLVGMGIYSVWKAITEEIKATTSETENLVKSLQQIPDEIPANEFIQLMAAAQDQIDKVQDSLIKRASLLPGPLGDWMGGPEAFESYYSISYLRGEQIKAIEERAAKLFPIGSEEYNLEVQKGIAEFKQSQLNTELHKALTSIEGFEKGEEALDLSTSYGQDIQKNREAIYKHKDLLEKEKKKIDAILESIRTNPITILHTLSQGENIGGGASVLSVINAIDNKEKAKKVSDDISEVYVPRSVDSRYPLPKKKGLSESQIVGGMLEQMFHLTTWNRILRLPKSPKLVESTWDQDFIKMIGDMSKGFIEIPKLIWSFLQGANPMGTAHALGTQSLPPLLSYSANAMLGTTNLGAFSEASLFYHKPLPSPERPGLGGAIDIQSSYLDKYGLKAKEKYTYGIVKPAKELAGQGGSAGGGGAFDISGTSVVPSITPIAEALENPDKALNAPNLEMNNSHNTFNITVNVDNEKSAAEIVEEMARVLQDQQYLPYTIQVGR